MLQCPTVTLDGLMKNLSRRLPLFVNTNSLTTRNDRIELHIVFLGCNFNDAL